VSRILKGEGRAPEAPPARAPVVPSELYDARRDAREVLESAERDAAGLRASVREEVERALEAARAEGYASGLAQATEVVARAHAEREALLASAERDIVELSLRAAEKILGREVTEHAAAVDIVAQALGAVRRARRVRVRISPDDAPALRAAEGALVSRLAQLASFELALDAAIARGGCIVETDSGSVDARLETQVAALRRALLGDG
jgi:type III secretion protein L